MKQIYYLILLSLLVSGCSLIPKTGDNTSLNPGGQIAIPTPSDQGLSQSGVKLGSEVDLSGQADPQLPGVTPPALSFSAADPSLPAEALAKAGDPSVPLVASGRIVPVADKDGKYIVGWRILGEIFNGTKELVENAQMLVELAQNDSKVKNILPESVQSGGFIPLKSGDRGVYDILIAASALQEPGESFSADRISIGVRRLADPVDLVRLDVKDLKFTPQTVILSPAAGGTKDPADTNSNGILRSAQNDTITTYKVTATIVNNTKSAIVGPILRFWAVVDRGETPQGARTADQVVAVATWESPQEILPSGQSKKLETVLNPLTQSDRQLMATSSAQLSALAAAKLLK